MLQPKTTKYRKSMKGRNRGVASSGNTLSVGEFALASQEAYMMTDFEVYNFFPRTPHIETLAVLRRK